MLPANNQHGNRSLPDNHKELNSVDNLNEPGSEVSPRRSSKSPGQLTP